MASRSRGFILMYVVALLAAIAIILFELGRTQSPSPMFMEKQIAHVIERREGQLLLDFVIAGVEKQKLPVDPRYLQFKRIIAARPRPTSELEVQLSWLKSVLSQFNFNINENKAKPNVEAKSTEETEQSEVPYEGSDVLFAPRRDAYRFRLGQVEYEVRVMPGNALPNLNSIEYDPLRRYLEVLGIPPTESGQLAAALIDWRDADSFRAEGIGAESEYYYGMHPPYAPRNAPIRSWQELNFVRGMTPEWVNMLREGFMLGKPDKIGISPDFSSPEVFAALSGLKPETVRAILKEYGKIEGGKDVVDDILVSEDAEAFDRVVSWKGDDSLLRIRIHSPNNTLTVDYDTKAKRILAWW